MYKQIRERTLLFTIVLFFTIVVNGQDKESRVKYEADFNEYDINIGNGARRLIGHVVFYHNGAEMYCDSAYYYSEKNEFDAFGHVFINQGDTLHLFSDFLNYIGSTKIATTRRNVRLVNKETTLTTQELKYDMENNVGYYTHFAHIVNNENTLESIVGYYYTRNKDIYFSDSVEIITPDYTIYSDTLKYNTESEIAYFFGPTKMIGDSSEIYCEKGWYDTNKELAEIRENASITDSSRKVTGEYIYFNKITGEGIAKTNVEIFDFEQNIIFTGNFARYNEITEDAFITDRAQFIQISDNDSLFLHADSLLTYQDTLENKIILGFNHVKFYRNDVQGMCDSLVYTSIDSTAYMYGLPVLWAEKNQLTAESIVMLTKNRKLEKMYLNKDALISSKEDTSSFNQLKGKNIVCYFNNNKLKQIDVDGGRQSVYHLKDGNDITGVDISSANSSKIFLDNNSITDIKNRGFTEGVVYPPYEVPEEKSLLKGFVWLDSRRPKSKLDIFNF